MENNTFYNEILIDHNIHPAHKGNIENPDIVLEGVNPSCGDDLVLQLKVEGDTITDGAFQGYGCAISQSSADIMIDMVVGKSKDEAMKLIELFKSMIKGTASEEDIEYLEEAGALRDIAHMPARVKCAMLGWKTLGKMIADK